MKMHGFSSMRAIVLWIGGVLVICSSVRGQEDSLRSALSAFDKRQKYLNRYLVEGPNENLEFLPEEGEMRSDRPYRRNALTDRALVDYLDRGNYLATSRSEKENKEISSPFRERVEEDKEKQGEELAGLLLNSLNNGQNIDDASVVYGELIDEILGGHPNKESCEKRKTRYYPSLSDVEKRSRYFQPDGPSDSLYLLNYTPRDEIFNRLQQKSNADDQDLNDHVMYYPESNRDYIGRERKMNNFQRMYPPAYHKRFPVSKRSSNRHPSILYAADFTKQYKRSPKANRGNLKTDPKVEKELGNLFGTPATGKSGNKTKNLKTANKSKSKNGKNVKTADTKEVAPVVPKAEPLQIKKKSVDWSDYFGLDRRKKSENLDNEWLMERYHKAVSMATKRSTDYPPHPFHDKEKKEKTSKSEETKILEMDEKLKNMEDAIVDDTLKYTGAHEGTTDSKAVQAVKDRVISQLAAAYSLEKMRRALEEYKLSMAKQLNEQKQSENLFSEEKRVSVPRKQAVDEEVEKPQEEDNNIKCTKGALCEVQNYKIPNEVLEQYRWGVEECPKIQSECNDFAATIGKYGHVLEIACNLHHMCLLCDDNSWFPPTVRCNALFLTKANELCSGNADCQQSARMSLESLLEMNTSMQDVPSEGCNLICPESKR